MKKYMIEYKDWSDFGCGEIWPGKDEKEAIISCQKNLIQKKTKLDFHLEIGCLLFHQLLFHLNKLF